MAEPNEGRENIDPDKDDEGGAGDDSVDSEDDEEGQSDKDGVESGDRASELEKELAAQRDRTRRARRDRERLEKEIKALKARDTPELEQLKSERDELRAEREKLAGELREQRLKVAFFNSNTHKWKNPATALRLADMSEVEVDDDGEVTGLKEVLDALAKSDPYLVADKEDKEEKPKGPTGTAGTKKEGGKPSNLASRFPALRTRSTN